MVHDRDEEQKLVEMVVEWVRRWAREFDNGLIEFLFFNGSIAHDELVAQLEHHWI